MGSVPFSQVNGCAESLEEASLCLSDRVELTSKLGEIWSEVLGRSVDPAASFLANGGDSLRATQAAARIRTRLRADVSLKHVIAAQSVADLADRVARAPTYASRSISSASRSAAGLSFSQERMWFMHALASASAAYHVPLAIRLRGRVQFAALQTALDRVVDRHEPLRSTFVSHRAGITARTAQRRRVEISRVDLSQTERESVLDHAKTYLSEFTNGTFNLERGPLLRAVLVRLGEDDAVLLVVLHHIVADQWSLDVLLHELSANYREAVSGTTANIPPLTTPYLAYAHWHRCNYNEHQRAHELSYWRNKLADLEPVVLNADFQRPPQQTFRGAKIRVDVSRERIDALSSVGARHGCTLAMVLMSALKVLLHRHTGSADIAIGVPIANRQVQASEGLIGTLVNTLVLRTEVDDRCSLVEAMSRVRTTALEAYEHQDTPFEVIVNALQLTRDASRSPLFSVMFNMLNTPVNDVSFPELEWSRFDFDKKASQFDLTVTVDTHHDQSICFEYSQDLFAPESIERLALHYFSILDALCEDDQQAIGAVNLISSSEHALLNAWQQGPQRSLPAVTVADLLKATCKRTPQSPALTIEDETFSYEELDTASDRLAAQLHAHSIGRGSRVGLCLPRSAQLIIAQWACLKAGCTYVPLDPSYPRSRLEHIANDADLTALIADPALASKASWLLDRWLTIDVDRELAQQPPSTINPELLARGEDAAYLLYTSGSTGQPKGAAVPHRAVVNFLLSMQHTPGIAANDRVLAVTTLSFDIAVLELLLPWTAGAHVVLARELETSDGDALAKLISAHDITLMQATPSTWRLLIESNWTGSSKLRALVGGEPLTRSLAAELLSRCTDVWNMYGPTETTVWSTCWRVDLGGNTAISLGRPIDNTQIYVLDDRLQPTPIGVPGEIYIGGEGVATGYFNRAELTRERFIQHPSYRNARLYRTGDRGRWRFDGALEHLGRVDMQVKIRGHRIELGEIEACLERHPGIARAVVTMQEDQAHESRLVAFLVTNGHLPETPVLKAHVREWLPEYMLPHTFIEVDAIPLLPNGKTDLRRLPVACLGASSAHAAHPRTPTEHALWTIWADILNTEQFGIHDNFFDLGGHSILSVRLVSRIRTDMHLACTLPMVFRNPTVATLAESLASASPFQGSSLIALQPLGPEPPLFCICGIQLYQELANRLAPDVPVYGVFVPMEMEFISPTHDAAPAVERLATEYLNTIRARQPHGPYRLLGFSFGGVLAYEMAQQLKREGEEIAFLAILDSDVPERRKRQRPAKIEERLKVLKQRVGARLKTQLHRMGGHSDEHVAEARDEQYLLAMRTYAAAPYSGEAVYIEAKDAPLYDPGYGWDALVANLHKYRIGGDHLGILSAPNVDELVQNLRRHLRLA